MKHFRLLPLLSLFLIVFSFAQQGTAQTPDIAQISPIRAKLMARNGAVMVDVRTPKEINALAYDVEGIMTIPLSELPDRMSEIPKDKEVIMVCASGNRSQKAAILLRQNGYEQVMNMEGGIAAWQAKDLEVIVDGKAAKKACCADPKRKDCNPDGSCKPGTKSSKKACCSDGKKKK